MALIKNGYQLSVTSWENDGDNYKTVVTNGLSEEDVKFLIHLGQNFSIKNNNNDDGYSDETVECFVEESLEKFPNVTQSLAEEANNNGRFFVEKYILSYASEGYEHEYCRVFDSYDVNFISSDCPDVTKQFDVVKTPIEDIMKKSEFYWKVVNTTRKVVEEKARKAQEQLKQKELEFEAKCAAFSEKFIKQTKESYEEDILFLAASGKTQIIYNASDYDNYSAHHGLTDEAKEELRTFFEKIGFVVCIEGGLLILKWE